MTRVSRGRKSLENKENEPRLSKGGSAQASKNVNTQDLSKAATGAGKTSARLTQLSDGGSRSSVSNTQAPQRASQSDSALIHMGDVLHAFQEIKNDPSHGNYLVATLSPELDSVIIHNRGGDSERINAHEACLRTCEKLFAANIPSWGVYSYKAIEDSTPGSKKHSNRANGFLLTPPNTAGNVLSALQSIKQRAKNVMFKGCDVFTEMHSVEDLNSDAYWETVHAQTPGGHRSSKIFLGGHADARDVHASRPSQKAPALSPTHHDISEKAAEMEQRRSRVLAAHHAEVERERRISEHKEALEESAQERRNSRLAVSAAVHREKLDRIRRSSSLEKVHMAAAERRISRMKQEMLSTENVEKMENRERKANRQSALARMDEVQREFAEEQAAVDENMENHIQRTRRKSLDMQDAERQRRTDDGMHEEYKRCMQCKKLSAHVHEELIEAADEMERKHERRSVNAAVMQEHQRRISDHGPDGKSHTTFKQRRSKELLQDDLKTNAVLRF